MNRGPAWGMCVYVHKEEENRTRDEKERRYADIRKKGATINAWK